MKIVVDLEDFWLDSDESLDKGLREYVKRSIFNEIEKSIKSKVETQITVEVKRLVDENLYKTITNNIKTIVSTGTTKSRNDSKKDITLEEYVKECFNYNGGWQSFNKVIEDLAKSFSSELKKRYDLLFASQIVAKLNENGMLKEDVAKMLVETIDKK